MDRVEVAGEVDRVAEGALPGGVEGDEVAGKRRQVDPEPGAEGG
jgi:hypothetical protein